MGINSLTEKTVNNLMHLYNQITAKYSEGNSCNIAYNGYIYTSLNKVSKDDYIINDFHEKIPFPYPPDVMTYIYCLDALLEDIRILRTLLIKAENMQGIVIKNLISNNLEIFSDSENINIHFKGDLKNKLYKILDDSPEAIEVIKKFNANNLLL